MAVVVLLGDINIDLVLDIPAFPAEGGEAIATRQTVAIGGSATNTAITLARAGHERPAVFERAGALLLFMTAAGHGLEQAESVADQAAGGDGEGDAGDFEDVHRETRRRFGWVVRQAVQSTMRAARRRNHRTIGVSDCLSMTMPA